MARYVSLCPSVTETLFDLGVGDEVVGATKFCVRPETGVEHVARVGGTKDPRIDRIVALAPTLVLMNEEENRREDADALAAAGVRLHVSFPRRVADVPDTIRTFGRLVGRRARAEELASAVEREAEAARRLAEGRRPTRFLALVWREPWMAVGPDTFASDLLTTAGGLNVVEAGGERYPPVEPESIVEMRPDIVLLPSEPFPFAERHVDELARRTRIGSPRFLRCDGQRLTWHGSRTAAGMAAAARWLA